MSENVSKIIITGDATGVEAATKRAKDALEGLGTTVKRVGQETGKGVEGIGNGADVGAKKIDSATKSIIGSIQRTTSVMEAGERGSSKYYAALAAQRGVSADVLKPYLDQLDAAKAKQIAATGSLNSMSMSAKQLSASMRGVPAQFTDIVVSLQGGQAPMNVLLQQGGQLKDMFGGVGNAFKALGGYALGMINPMTMTIAAAAGLGYAFYRGTQETSAYNEAIINTGRAAGVTAGNLADMAGRIGSTTSVTTGLAAESLAAFAANGNIAADKIERFSALAARLQNEAGTAVADTAKQFADLGKDPVTAALKLNETTRFLTISIYEQIKAATEQGNTAKAASIAQDAYADVTTKRLNEVKDSLSFMGQAWENVANAAKHGWDAMAGLLRKDSDAQSMAGIQNDILAKQARIDRLKSEGGGLISQWQISAAEKDVAALQAQLPILQQKIALQNESAKSAAAESAQVAARSKWDKEGEQYKSKAIKLEEAINKAKIDGLAAGRSQIDIDTRILALKKQYAEAPSKQENAYANTYKQLLESLNKYIPQLNAEIDGTNKLTESQKLALEVKRKLTEADQNRLAPLIEAARIGEIALEQQKLMTQAADEAYRAEQKRAEEMSKNAAGVAADVIRIKEHTEEIGLSKGAIDAVKASRDADTIALKDHELAELDATGQCSAYSEALRDNIAALKDRQSALGQQSSKQFGEDARKKADAAWQKTADKIEDSITDALMRGFESGKGFAENLRDTVVNMFKTMVLRPVVQATVQGGLTAIGLGGAGNALAGASGGVGNALSLSNTAYGLFGANTIAGSAGSGMYGAMATSAFGQTLGLSSVVPGLMGPTTSGVALGASTAGGATLTGLGAALPYIGGAIAIASLIGGMFGKSGERFKTVTGSSSGEMVDGSYINNGATGEYAGKYAGTNVTAIDDALGTVTQAYLARMSSLYSAFGVSDNISATTDTRLRRTSGDFHGNLRFDADGDGPGATTPVLNGIYEVDGDTQKGLTEFINEVMTKGIKGAIAVSTLPDLVKEAFAPLTESAEIDAALNAVIGAQSLMVAAGTTLSEFLGDNAKDYMQGSENLIGMITRLTSSLAVANPILEQLGLKIFDISLVGADAASSLASMFGSLENLQKATADYYAGYYSEDEKLDKLRDSVSKQFAALGETMPTTRDGLRSLVDSLDLTTDAGAKTFAGLMALAPAFGQVADAAAEAAKTAAEAAANARAADQKALNDARSAAADLVAEMTASFSELQNNIRDEARASTGGLIGGLDYSGAEYSTVSNFVGYLDSANEKLTEIAASPFADSLSEYAVQIRALSDATRGLAADVLTNTRLLAGDIAGAVAAVMSKTPMQSSDYMLSRQGDKPGRHDFASRADFDAAFAKWESPQFNAGAFNHALELAQVKASVAIGDMMSANALKMPNVSGGYSAEGASSEFKYSILADISRQYNIGTQTALQDVLHNALGVAVSNAIHAQYTSKGVGIASVQFAQQEYSDAIESKYIDGRLVISRNAIAYTEGVRDITAALKFGRISADDYATGLNALTNLFGGGAGDINDARLAGGDAAERLARAGADSVNYYFGKMAEGVAELAAAASAASEPVALVAGSIGRMNSASTVFGVSAGAVMDGFMGMMGAGQSVLADGAASDAQRSIAGQMVSSGAAGRAQALTEGSGYRNATLVSAAASVVSQIMTTQSANEAAKKLAESASFAGSSATQIRDASLLMDGLTAFNAPALEATFNRLSSALATRKITEAQYVDMFGQSIETFRGVDQEAEAVKAAMQSLAEAMGGFADKLLIDQQRTTIGAVQSLAELNRQYAVARDSAVTGDREAVGKYQSLASAMLDKGLYDNQAAYNDAFGKVYGDARNLEAVGVNTLAGLNGTSEVVSELKSLNTSLSNRVEQLEKNLTTALAQIAKNTAKTSSGIEQINTVGLPA